MSSDIIDPITNKYQRYNSYQSEILKTKIGYIYESNLVSLTNSGHHANFIAIDTLLRLNYKNDINIIVSFEDTYYETVDMLLYFKKYNHNINIFDFDIKNDNIINLFTSLNNQINILFIESCTNPFGYIFNFDLIQMLKSLSNKLYIICDNSWLSGVLFNPLEYVDIVTISLTKHYSGGGKICGACIFNNKVLYDITEEHIKHAGIHINQQHLAHININIDNINKRIKITQILTKHIITYLITNNIEIYHPMNCSHPSYIYAIKFLKSKYPSIILININKSKEEIEFKLNNLNIIKVSPSFGSNETTIDPWIYENNNKYYLRLSVGYTSIVDEIINEINILIK